MAEDPDKPTSFKVTMVIIILICCWGIFANILCLIVLLRKKMKSSFNTILLGLTISDLLLLAKSSATALNNLRVINLHLSTNPWGFQTLFIVSWLCDGGTKYFTVAVSVERYLVTCFPLKARVWMTYSRSRKFAASVAIYVFILTGINFYFQYYSTLLSYRQLEIVKAVVLNFGPFVAIFVLNVLIYAKLRKSQNMKKSVELKKSDSSANSSSANRMLLTVVLVFGFCYSFEFTRRVMSYFVTLNVYENPFHFAVNTLADIFYVINSSSNFLIYYLLGKKFRSEFLDLFSCCFKKKEKPKQAIFGNNLSPPSKVSTSSTPTNQISTETVSLA